MDTPLSRSTAASLRTGAHARRPVGRQHSVGHERLQTHGASWSHWGLFRPNQRGGQPHASDHDTTEVVGFRAVVRRASAVLGNESAAGVGTPVVAPVALRDVRPPRVALRPATGAAVAACAVGGDDGVAALCAVAGVVPVVAGCGSNRCRGRSTAARSRRRARSWWRIWRRRWTARRSAV